jgi:tetratricopeptide (TPR) repeat protein
VGSIGQVYHQKGELDKALGIYKEFLRLTQLHFGENHRDICMVTTCIGQVYHEKEDRDSAVEAFQHSLRVGRVVLGQNHPDVGITLNQLGNVYYEAGDFEAALKVYHQGLELEVEMLTMEGDSPNLCVTYINIAEIHRQRSEYGEALKYYQKLLAHQRKYKSTDVDIASTLSHIGMLT